jgi:hypothetical protein
MSLAFTPPIQEPPHFLVAINYTGQATLSTIHKSFAQFPHTATGRAATAAGHFLASRPFAAQYGKKAVHAAVYCA